jgi:hypothetical protein
MSRTLAASKVRNAEAITQAEIWVTAKQLCNIIKEELKEAEADRVASAEALSGLMSHGDTVTVFNNRTMVWYDKTQRTTSWSEVVKAMMPHLTDDQRVTLSRIIDANTKPDGKVVRRLTPAK